jgi:Carboxypeptidase regulatory-like domain/TonB dependent receptor-like, beta-barrel
MATKVTCTAFVLMLVALFVVSAATSASAQAVYGSIIGTVTDPQGAAVPNAKVTVTNVRKGTSDVVTTNEQGNYSVTHLIPDVYDVSVTAQGFKTASAKGVSISADNAARVDLAVPLGSTSEAIEVTAEAPQLKTDRADVATTFNEKYVTELPILNRNFTQFELLSPGTQKLVGWSHASTENPQGSQQIFVNGQHFSGTAYELDGTDNQDPILGIIVVNPNIDAITETKINLQNWDAEFGKAIGGVVTVQTKSGSNDYHGTGFWYRRTDATSARNPFTQFERSAITGRFIPEDRWNQFGGTFGGPIIKNKLFFFGDYQGTRQAFGQTAQLTIPTQQVLNSCIGAGDGSGFCKLDQYTALIGNTAASSLIYDPATGNSDGTGRTPFCGPAGCATQPNWIPIGRIPGVVQNILSLFPSPGNGNLQQNLIASGSGPFRGDQWDARGDWTVSNTMTVFGRFSMAKFDISGSGLLGAVGGLGNGIGGLSGSSITHNYSLATGFTKTLSNTLLTDFRFGYFKYNPTTHKQREGDTPVADVGIPNVNDLPGVDPLFVSGWSSFAYPGGSIMGGENIGNFGEGLNVGRCNCPLVQSEQQFQWVNNWTKIMGNHSVKFGADIRYAMNLRVPSDANRAGVFNFDRTTTSNAGVGGFELASFLLGDVRSFQRFVSTSTTAAERQKRLFFYGQDSWRLTPNLTLNYGLRWEIYTPETVNGTGNGGFANLDRGEIRVAGVGGIGLNGDVENDWHAFAPRLGIAYQVTPKTVVRLGYGRSYDIGVFGSNFGHAVTQNLPVLVNQTINAPGGFGQYFPAFNLTAGPPLPTATVVPADGILPLSAGNGSPRIRPTKQTLPTLDAWNVTVQRQLTNTLSFEVAYIGSKGTHMFSGNDPSYDVNQVAYAPGTAVVTTAGVAPSFTASGGVTQDQRRPFFNRFNTGGVLCCGAGTMGNYYGNDSSNNYNALQMKLDKRFSQGLQFQTSYTWSKSLNYVDDDGFLYSVAPQTSYGPSAFNRDHVFISNVTYELPFGKGKMFGGNASRALDLIIGGWQMNNTLNISSGLPFTPFASNCGGVTDTGPCVPDKVGDFPVGAGTFDPISHTVTYFTPVAPLAYPASALTVGTDTCTLSRPTSGAFALSECGRAGLAGRNSFRGPGGWKDDLSVAKNFRITERFSTQFRADIFNVFNHPVYGFSSGQGGGGTCIDCSGNNGKITDLENGSTMRQMQFALKVIF